MFGLYNLGPFGGMLLAAVVTYLVWFDHKTGRENFFHAAMGGGHFPVVAAAFCLSAALEVTLQLVLMAIEAI